MIHEIGVELAANLRASQLPGSIPVVDGPEPTKQVGYARERIVIEYDEAGDTFSNVKTQFQNPKARMVRNIGVKITIYAQSAKLGALHWEHKRRCDMILDMVLCSLYEVVTARQDAFVIKSGKYTLPEDTKDTEIPGNAVYELKLTIDRGVFKTNYAGEPAPQVAIGDDGLTIGSTTKVQIYNGPTGQTQETSCG